MKGEVKVCPDCDALVSVSGDCACCKVCMLVVCECDQDPNHDRCYDCDNYRDECVCDEAYEEEQQQECQYPLKPKMSNQAKCLCCNTQVVGECEVITVDFRSKLVLNRRKVS